MSDPQRADDPNAGPPRAEGEGGQARRFLTIEELAAATTLSVSTLRRLHKRGAIAGHQPGGPRHRLVFPPDAIEQAARASQAPTAAPAPGPAPKDATPRPLPGPRPRWARRQ
jgi:excisionase family DNA binding protein